MLSADRKTRETAFTLIELLVVVAIIALLISILLPSLKKAKDQARQVVCGTHQRELYVAATEYATNNRDYYPRGIQGRTTGEYAIFPSCILPYVGYDGHEELWGPATSGVNSVVLRLNKIMTSFDIFKCSAFPVEFYDNPHDQRFYYSGSAQTEQAFGPGGVNPLQFIASAFSMPYAQFAEDNDEPDLCWNDSATQHDFDPPPGAPYYYAESSKLEDFPTECQPSTRIYLTGVDKTVPWVKAYLNGGAVVGLRYNTMFLTSHLSFASRPRMGEDSRHPGGLNCLFFDGHTSPLNPHKMDPGCESKLDERLNLFTAMRDDWTP